jgi:hypothetical protein
MLGEGGERRGGERKEKKTDKLKFDVHHLPTLIDIDK